MPIACISCDIDGTIALGTHREHFIKRTEGDSRPKDWDSYFSLMEDDEPNWPIVETLKGLARTYPIIYPTARPAKYTKPTLRWFSKYAIPFGPIGFRPDGDWTPDDILKLKIIKDLEAEYNYQVILHFEDRDRVVIALRNAGYLVAQVAEGKF